MKEDVVDDLSDYLPGRDIDYYCSPVYDTQIYPPRVVSGGGDSSDDEFELKMDGDSEPPTDIDTDVAEDAESEDSEAPMVVSKAAKVAVRKKKTDSVLKTFGGGGKTWSDASREFVSYLTSVKLPI